MSRLTTLPLVKALGLAVILGGALYGGYAWLNPDEEVAAPAEPSARAMSGAAPNTSSTDMTPVPGRIQAQAVAQAYASDRQVADARFKGQRMQLQGVVNGIESGQGQVLLVTLGADEGHAGLRAVIDGGAQPLAAQIAVGQPLSLDCLNQGLLMGEPVLSDCRVLP